MKLVHWSLMGGLLHLVQRWGNWAVPQPAQVLPRCTECNSLPTNASVPIAVSPLFCGFNVPIKGLSYFAQSCFTWCGFRIDRHCLRTWWWPLIGGKSRQPKIRLSKYPLRLTLHYAYDYTAGLKPLKLRFPATSLRIWRHLHNGVIGCVGVCTTPVAFIYTQRLVLCHSQRGKRQYLLSAQQET